MYTPSTAIAIALMCASAYATPLKQQTLLYPSTNLDVNPSSDFPYFKNAPSYDLSHIYAISVPSGTIFMTRKGDSITPVTFGISGVCSALSTEFSSLNRYVGQTLIESHYSCASHLSLCREFQETAIILIGGVEYRATLDLIVEREMGIEFQNLVGLLVGTARELFEVTEERAVEMISLSGEIYGVKFEAWWTWYSFIDGLAKGC